MCESCLFGDFNHRRTGLEIWEVGRTRISLTRAEGSGGHAPPENFEK